jgi:hypothetical protein
MLRISVCSAAAAAVIALVPAAVGAGGPSSGALQGGAGVVSGGVRYVALNAGVDTMLERISVRDGRLLRYVTFPGHWGIPLVTQNGATGGLDPRGSMLVLGDASPRTAPMLKETHFLVVNAKTLRITKRVDLRGDFGFDAISPDAKTLYLIQNLSGPAQARYRVRAYDLRRDRLLPRVIADKTQESWVMRGYAVSRATGFGGRWVYTFYSQPDNYPFVHALNTVSRVAVCIGVPWKWADAEGIFRARLSLTDNGRMLRIIDTRSNRVHTSIDTRTLRVS